MIKNKVQPIRISMLYKYASDYYKYPTDESKIETINMTDIFWKDLEHSIKNNKRIMIEITGDTRDGKSTVACVIGYRIFNEMILKYYPKEKLGLHKEFGLHNICADQQEMQEIMTDDRIHHTVLISDEENESEKGGVNSSAENDQRIDQSNIQAARYIHIIKCHPYGITDPNTKILLHVVDRDTLIINKKKRNITRCKLYYILREGSMIEGHPQYLGFVDIDVTDYIKNWVTKIEPIMFLEKPKEYVKKQIKKYGKKATQVGTKEHKKIVNYIKYYESCQKIIEKYKQKDWYVKYQLRKYYLIDLPQKKGIQRKRMLKYAKITKDIVEDYKELFKYDKIDMDMIKNTLRNKFRENKIPYSIIGEEMAAREIKGILQMYKSIFSKKMKILKEESKNNPNKKIIEEYQNNIKLYEKELKKVMDELNLMIKIYDEMRGMIKNL